MDETQKHYANKEKKPDTLHFMCFHTHTKSRWWKSLDRKQVNGCLGAECGNGDWLQKRDLCRVVEVG